MVRGWKEAAKDIIGLVESLLGVKNNMIIFDLKKLYHNHKKVIIFILSIIFLIISWQLGFLKYLPEINTPIGKFIPNDEQNSISNQNNSLNNIYDLPIEFKDMTSYQVDIRSQKYLKKKYEVVGYVTSVRKDSSQSTTLMVSKTIELIKPFVFCDFNQKWNEQLLVLGRKEKVQFTGEISGIISDSVTLENCELK